jgi:endonuclease YncB( thermonuclease family)
MVGIIDGDSVRVMHEGTVEHIRLRGIDPPEGKQPFGTKAKDATSTLAFGKVLAVQSIGPYRDK